jgi:hypothetical protein
LLGYAQFPDAPPETDGVVINYKAFGYKGPAESPFELGRTATHEVGHWLGLRHIWGHDDIFNECDGTDNIRDTPNQRGSNSGSPKFPSHKQKCPDTGRNGTMFMNYMDYTWDASMYMFTMGQAARMRSTLNMSRKTVTTTDVLKSPKEESHLRNLRQLSANVYDGSDSIVEVKKLL